MPQTPRLLTRFEDHFYAFDKPAGMAVHKADDTIPDLVSWIHRQSALPRGLRPGHRLDRATSGVVLCGATGAARAQIASWLESEAQKHYLALVAGSPESETGSFTDDLFDDRRRRKLNCETGYVVRERYRGFCLLELSLVTGRKHQIRRHLANAGLPIVGDRRYGPKRPKRVPGFPGRLWLHAWTLSLGERRIEAPLPEALQTHLALLNQELVHP